MSGIASKLLENMTVEADNPAAQTIFTLQKNHLFTVSYWTEMLVRK